MSAGRIPSADIDIWPKHLQRIPIGFRPDPQQIFNIRIILMPSATENPCKPRQQLLTFSFYNTLGPDGNVLPFNKNLNLAPFFFHLQLRNSSATQAVCIQLTNTLNISKCRRSLSRGSVRQQQLSADLTRVARHQVPAVGLDCEFQHEKRVSLGSTFMIESHVPQTRRGGRN